MKPFSPFFPSRSEVMLPLTHFLHIPSLGASGFFAGSEYRFWANNFCVLDDDHFFLGGIGVVCFLWGDKLGWLCSLWGIRFDSLLDIGEGGRSLSGDSQGSWLDDLNSDSNIMQYFHHATKPPMLSPRNLLSSAEISNSTFLYFLLARESTVTFA